MIEIVKMTEHQDEEVQTVEVDIASYDDLIWRDSLLSMILKGLFETASLSYSGDALYFRGDEINQILRYGFPEIYKGTLAQLKAEKAKKDAEAERDEMIQLVNLKDEEEQKDAESGE